MRCICVLDARRYADDFVLQILVIFDVAATNIVKTSANGITERSGTIAALNPPRVYNPAQKYWHKPSLRSLFWRSDESEGDNHWLKFSNFQKPSALTQ